MLDLKAKWDARAPVTGWYILIRRRDGECRMAFRRDTYSDWRVADAIGRTVIRSSEQVQDLFVMGAEIGRVANRALDAERRVQQLEALINTPRTDDWLEAVRLEAAHQVERWGVEHDAGKALPDWFWLLGYLAGKALNAAVHGDTEKALHHTISSGAVLLNWWRHLKGIEQTFRPGIAPPDEGGVA
jgi:hypothetical protein